MRSLLPLVLAAATLAACGNGTTTSKTSGAATPAAAPAASATAVVPGGAVSNAVASAVALQCEQRAHDVQGNDGTSWFMKCPAGCATGDSVWGTELYTDDSALCRAAIHAGAASVEQGGTFLVTWAPAQETYVGTEQHGITTADYGNWPRSFFIQSVDAGGKPTSPAPTPMSSGHVRVSCRMAVANLGGDVGKQWRIACPAGCGSGSVWGTDVYTADSPLCSAAMHAGVVSAAGGEATVTIGGAQKSFKGSVRNGVTTQDYGEYGSSFTVAK